MNAKLLDKMKEQGMIVNEVDKSEFRKAVQPVYDQYIGEESGKVSQDLYHSVVNFKA
jgi:TRAP-type C4-dicarboxylate transport system substrate-binding protein